MKKKIIKELIKNYNKEIIDLEEKIEDLSAEIDDYFKKIIKLELQLLEISKEEQEINNLKDYLKK